MGLKLITTDDPQTLTLDEVKTFLRIDGTEFDVLLTSLIGAAYKYCADFQNRQYGIQTWDWTLDDFPKHTLNLPKSTLQSVVSLSYTDHDGVTTTWDPSNYIVDTDSDPGRISLAYQKTWPYVQLQPINGVRIRFTCGIPDLPETFKQAMLLFIQDRFDNPTANINPAVHALLWPDRVVPL